MLKVIIYPRPFIGVQFLAGPSKSGRKSAEIADCWRNLIIEPGPLFCPVSPEFSGEFSIFGRDSGVLTLAAVDESLLLTLSKLPSGFDFVLRTEDKRRLV